MDRLELDMRLFSLGINVTKTVPSRFRSIILFQSVTAILVLLIYFP
jgi:hypothetical protein